MSISQDTYSAPYPSSSAIQPGHAQRGPSTSSSTRPPQLEAPRKRDMFHDILAEKRRPSKLPGDIEKERHLLEQKCKDAERTERQNSPLPLIGKADTSDSNPK